MMSVLEKKSPEETIALHSVEEAIADIKAGKIVIVVDDEDRENEGDFICAAEMVTPDIINFMAMHGRGLICTPLEETRANELRLNMMVQDNTALHETAFTVSIDLIGNGCTTGISAYDRATGIRALVNPEITARDFARPGHIFPLKAKTGGVLRRTGHTEAAVDLAKMAGFFPAGVLVEILNEDGSMARLPQLIKIARKFDLKIISIKDLIAYRMRTERIVKREKSMLLQSVHGEFEVIAYSQITSDDIHFAIKKGEWEEGEELLVRVHSSSETSDVFSFLFGNNGYSLQNTLGKIAEAGKGVLLYMHHKEKTPDLLHRLEQMCDKDNPHHLLPMDSRDYGVGAQILRDLGVSKMRLMSHAPRKRVGMIGYGLEIVENIQV